MPLPEGGWLKQAGTSVATNGVTAANVVVQTQQVAVKETGPRETVEAFGEVYAFSPSFFAAHWEEATMVRLWNLQPDDNHGFMLIDPHGQAQRAQRAAGGNGDGRWQTPAACLRLNPTY